MPRVVVVGAGVSGLALAYRLRSALPGVDLTVLEESARPGGPVWTDRRDGFQFECGPNGFLDSKPSTLNLCRDLGIADDLIPASESSRRNRFVFINEKLRALPSGPFGLLRTPLLSLRGKLALLSEPFRRRGTALDESVAAFAKRRAGREAATVFADALVTGIHGGDPELLSMRAAFPRVMAMESEHGSVIRGFLRASKRRRAEAKARGEPPPPPQRMWSFRSGLRRLTEALRDALPRPPLTGAGVRRIERSADGWIVRGGGADAWPADAVVLTCPAYRQAEIVADLDPALAERIAGIPYNAVAVVAVGYRQSDVPNVPDGFGYIAPQNTRRDLLGVQWCSAIFPDRAPPGCVLWRALCGGWHRAEVAGWDDVRLLAAVRSELRLALGVTADPVFHHIVRWPRAIPQYHVGHLERVVAIQLGTANHPGLFLAGNAYHGVAINDCTERAEVLAGRIAEFFASRRQVS